jgi:hypothetical protein
MGYDVKFHVFVDGKPTRDYEYQIRTRVFAWLPVLPFVWINLLTDGEEDAFTAVARRFFIEAQRDGAFNAPPAPSPPPAPPPPA